MDFAQLVVELGVDAVTAGVHPMATSITAHHWNGGTLPVNALADGAHMPVAAQALAGAADAEVGGPADGLVGRGTHTAVGANEARWAAPFAWP